MARRKKKRIASRGSVNNIILKTLVNGDKYGYEIIKEVEEISDGKFKLKQPSLYSSLSRFEDKKFVTSYWGDSDIGGRRHYYHITDLGLEYYRKAILKEDDDIEVSKDELEEIMSENIADNKKYTDEDELEEQVITSEEDDESDTLEQYTGISENEIPAIVHFEKTNEEASDSTFIPDHVFFKPTPIDNIISAPEPVQTTEPVKTNSEQEVEPWLALSNSVKESNSRISKTKFNTLYFKKPIKEQKVILDKDGIYKLRDADYIPTKSSPSSKIIDNVGKRTAPANLYGYSSYPEQKPSNNKSYSELSEDERRKRNENFLAKFNLITNSKMKPISAPTQKSDEIKFEKPIDYRGKLNAIIENNNSREAEQYQAEEPQQNNLFNYTTDNWNVNEQNNQNVEPSSIDDDQFVDLEPVQEFQTKANNAKYIEEISNYSSPPTQVQISRYETRQQAILTDKTFILINKLKFVFGIILTLLMIAELTIAYFAFKNSPLFMSGDNKVFIIGYVVIAIIAGTLMLPYCFNKNRHKPNNFKFKYAVWYGTLVFMVSIVLIYCFNALKGFELDNFKYFAVRIIIPMLLTFNFVLGPIIYGILNKNKAFYD